MLEYVHEFCTKQIELSDSLQQNHALRKKDYEFTFDYDVYDLCTFLNNHSDKKVKRKILNKDLLSQLDKNLIKISKMSNANEENKSNSFYLVYFCSNFINSNENMFKSVVSFIQLIKQKFKSEIKLILVSSDLNIEQYDKLLAKFDLNIETANGSAHFALDFEAAKIKHVLFKQIGVTGIPWLTLINSSNGELMSENLRNIILHSKLNSIEI